MQCSRCGSRIKDALKYCTKCKADLVLTQVSKTENIEKRCCTSCGRPMDNGKFCMNCEKSFDVMRLENKTSSKKNKKTKRKRVLLLIAACLILVLGIGGYFGVNHLKIILEGKL